MKVVESPAMRANPWVISVLTIGIFVFDMLTPVGVLISVLYIFPLLLTFQSSRERDLIYFSIIATALTWVNLFLEPPGISIPYGVLNRMLGTLVLWGVAMGLIHIRRVEDGLTITERALKTAWGQFKGIFEASKDAIGYAALDGTILLVNRAFPKLTSFSREELLRMNVGDLISEQHKEQRDRVVAQVLQTGEPVEYEIDYLRKDGSQVPVSITMFMVKGDDGKPAGLATIVRDLTEHKRTEEAVVRSMERLTLATRAADIGVWDWDISKNELVWDDQMFALYGLKKEDVGGAYDAWLSGVHPDDRARCDEAIQQALHNEKPYDLEFRVRWPDGTVHVIKANGLVVWNPQSISLRMTGTNYDITERKQAEAALKKVQEQFEGIFEASKDAIGYAALDGTILLVNRAFPKLTSFSREELLRMNVGDLISEQHKEQRDRVVAQVLQTGEPVEYEIDYLRKDGSQVPVSITMFMVKGDDGKPAGLATIVRDLTEHKRTEEAVPRHSRSVAEWPVDGG